MEPPSLRRRVRRDLTRSRWCGTWKHDALSALLTFATVGALVAPIVLFTLLPSPFTFVFAFLVVGVATHSLGVLGHETYHRTFFRSARANDLFGAWLFHGPLLGRFSQLKDAHLRHHRYFGTERDPDRDHWQWSPEDRNAHLRHLLGLAVGMSAVRGITNAVRKGSGEPSDGQSSSGGRRDLVAVAAAQFIIIGVFAVGPGVIWYPLLWLAPILTVGAVVEDLRVFAEHNGGRLLIFTRPARWEELVFARANFSLHAVHHLAPSEPWFALGARLTLVRERGQGLQEAETYRHELAKILHSRTMASPHDPVPPPPAS